MCNRFTNSKARSFFGENVRLYQARTVSMNSYYIQGIFDVYLLYIISLLFINSFLFLLNRKIFAE
jgi:hypothetical protein